MTCVHKNIVMSYKTGEEICGNCGLVLTEKMLVDEYSRDMNERQRERLHQMCANPYMHDKGLGTVILPNRRLSRYNFNKARKLSKTQRRTRLAAGDLTQYKMHDYLLQITSVLGLPGIVGRDVAHYIRKLFQIPEERKKLIYRGVSSRITVAVLVFSSCRHLGIPLTLQEMSKSLDISFNTLKTYFIRINRKIKLRPPILKPSSYINKYASKLGLSQATVSKAMRLLDRIKLRGARPDILATAVLYCAARKSEKCTFKMFAKIAYVTDISIREMVKRVRDEVNG